MRLAKQTYPSVIPDGPALFEQGHHCIRMCETVLVGWHAKPVDFVVSNRPGVVGYLVTAVAFYGVDVAILDLFYNADVVSDAVLAVGFDLIPIEVDNVAGIWCITAVLPLFAGSEPALAGNTTCGFRDPPPADRASGVLPGFGTVGSDPSA